MSNICIETLEDLERVINRGDISNLYYSLKNVTFDYAELYEYLTKNIFIKRNTNYMTRAERIGLVMEVSEATVYRWKASQAKVKEKDADRLSELIDLYLFGHEVLGSKAAFIDWLYSPNIHLNNKMPLDILDSLSGLKFVKHLLQKIEHGVPV